MKEAIINFKAYENGKEFLGVTKATLPDLTALTQTVSGAGIAGNIEAVILGQYDSMSLSLDFRVMTESTYKLAEPRKHTIDLRVAQQDEDPTTNTIGVTALKHVLVVVPKSTKGGSAAPASSGDASGEYAVRYWATYIDGKKTLEIDPLNNICYINGRDYLAPVRKALGN